MEYNWQDKLDGFQYYATIDRFRCYRYWAGNLFGFRNDSERISVRVRYVSLDTRVNAKFRSSVNGNTPLGRLSKTCSTIIRLCNYFNAN